MLKFVLLPVVGFLIGLLVVSLGGGGGMFYVGILTAFFGVPPAVAASTSLATIIPTTAAGALSHWKAGNVKLRLGLVMLAAGAAGAIAGSLCSSLLPHSLYSKLIGGFMLFIGAQMVATDLRKRRKTRLRERTGEAPEPEQGTTATTVAVAAFYGVLGGAMSGLIGLSGAGPILVGLSVLGCSAFETIGTSVFVLVGISTAGFLMHLGLGSVDWRLVGLLLIGTVSGAAVGPMLLKRIDKAKMQKVMHPLILVFVFGIGVMLLL